MRRRTANNADLSAEVYITDMKRNKKATVFILLGQSNAVGHAIPMCDEDKIKVPLKNVFGLKREYNQSFDISSLTWDGYTSGGMNLGEEQDDTYSVANCLAKLWQSEFDSGNVYDLPELYIVQIAIGAQGVTDGYMWNPDYPKNLVPGKLGTVDISLYPFTRHILSLVMKSLAERGVEAESVFIHWRGGENDSTASHEDLQKNLKNIYMKLFDSFSEALGGRVPTILHRIVCNDRCMDLDPSGEKLKKMHYINRVFDELSAENENLTVFDVRSAPQYRPDIRGNGIFIDDVVHFTSEVNNWVAQQILKYCVGKDVKN